MLVAVVLILIVAADVCVAEVVMLCPWFCVVVRGIDVVVMPNESDLLVGVMAVMAGVVVAVLITIVVVVVVVAVDVVVAAVIIVAADVILVR